MRINKYYFLVFFILSIGYLIFFFGKSFLDFSNDFAGPTKPTKTYYSIFSPSKQKLVSPYKTYFSKTHKPVALYELINKDYKLAIISLDVKSTVDFREILTVYNKNKPSSSDIVYKGYDLGAPVNVLGAIKKQPKINKIQLFGKLNSNEFQFSEGVDYVYYNFLDYLTIGFNNADFSAIVIEPKRNNIISPQIEILFLKRENHWYLIIGINGQKKPITEKEFLTTLFL